jgi:hypothetical protein
MYLLRGVRHSASVIEPSVVILLFERIAAAKVEFAPSKACTSSSSTNKCEQIDQRHRFEAVLPVNQDCVATLLTCCVLEGSLRVSTRNRPTDRRGGIDELPFELSVFKMLRLCPPIARVGSLPRRDSESGTARAGVAGRVRLRAGTARPLLAQP